MFGRLSLTGTVANLVAVPVAGLVMLVGLPACLVAGTVPFVGPVVMAPVGWGVWWVDAVATVAAAAEPQAPWSWAGWLALVVAVVWLVRSGARSPAAPGSPAHPSAMMGAAMSVHLLTGDDESILRAAVTDLVHELVGDGDRSLMVDEFDGDDVEVRAIVDSAQTPPFLTERRVVVARDVGRFSADELAPLVAYLADPLPTRRRSCSSAAVGASPSRSPTP